MLGVLLFTPPLLTYNPAKSSDSYLKDLQQHDALWATALLLLSSFVVLFQPFSLHLPAQFVVLPAMALMWLAAQCGIFETGIAIVLVAIIAIFSTAMNHGPFAQGDGQSNLLWLWMFVASLTLAGLFVSAVSASYRLSLARFKASEKRLAEAQRITHMGSWELDIASGELKWSDEIFRIFELDPNQFITSYDAFLQTIHPEDREKVHKAYQDSLQNRCPYSISHRLLMSDGRIKYVHEQCETHFDADGKPLRSLGTVHDITERKLAKRALDDSRSLLSLVIDSVPLSIYWKDKNRRYLGCNRLFVKDAGKTSASEVIGKTDEELGWIDQSERFMLEDLEVMNSGLPKLNYEESIAAPDGLSIILRNSKIALRNEKQEVIGLLGVYENITKRKRAEQELKKYRLHLEEQVAERTNDLEISSRRLSETEFAMDECGIGIYWVDAQSGQFIYVNAPVCEMLGYTEQELLSMSLPAVMPLFSGMDFQTVAGLFQQQGNTRFETIHKTKQGHTLPVEIVSFYRPPEDRLAGHFIAFVTDISQRKLTVTLLIEAKTQAEAANRAKSIFLANMSHELRTPLNVILGFTQLMERDANLASTHKMELQTIKRSGRHLLTLINDVLEISRIEAGSATISNEVFDLQEAINVTADMIRSRAEDKGLSFSVESKGQVPHYVCGDDQHLRQVLINLLGNAVKYTDKGHVILRVVPEDDHIRFEVSDTGIGIPEQDKEHIFQAFYQTENGVAKGEGTGLGLSISREFVHLMGGKLTVESIQGLGSTFAFTLFLPESAAPNLPRTKPRRVLALAEGQPRYQVLVAEDHADNRKLLACLLESVGFTVHAVNDGQQAVEAFKLLRPDFIWMDMRMPNMDGYTATQAIRALPGGQDVKIAAFTASAFAEDRVAILAAGCDDLLAKPIDQNALLQMMGRLLKLEYAYDDTVAAPETVAQVKLDLSALDSAQCDALRHAAEQLDMAAVQAFIESINSEHPETARALMALLREFRFEQILRGVERRRLD